MEATATMTPGKRSPPRRPKSAPYPHGVRADAARSVHGTMTCRMESRKTVKRSPLGACEIPSQRSRMRHVSSRVTRTPLWFVPSSSVRFRTIFSNGASRAGRLRLATSMISGGSFQPDSAFGLSGGLLTIKEYAAGASRSPCPQALDKRSGPESDVVIQGDSFPKGASSPRAALASRRACSSVDRPSSDASER